MLLFYFSTTMEVTCCKYGTLSTIYTIQIHQYANTQMRKYTNSQKHPSHPVWAIQIQTHPTHKDNPSDLCLVICDNDLRTNQQENDISQKLSKLSFPSLTLSVLCIVGRKQREMGTEEKAHLLSLDIT